MEWLDFSKYQDNRSKFVAELSSKGGYIVFSNSGKGRDRKFFTLSLESFLTCLKDIQSNYSSFVGHEVYVEKEWRDLGSKFYTDSTANAQSTVQTKSMFATLSKIIMWANAPDYDANNPEKTIILEESALQVAIDKLEILSNTFLPKIDLPNPTGGQIISKIPFNHNYFIKDLNDSRLIYSDALIVRFTASLLTKPFVILTGLSGSGKTKLAQAFVEWICQDDLQYEMVPVGADWTNREPLLGYPNALNPQEYVKPDSGVLDLVIRANDHPDLPYFLILDEMNLSHVERYFADFLSVMESKKEIQLHPGKIENGVPTKLKIPSNLFIIGTVNIDETTNMFSPKVLDRANTIEFRVTREEMKNFLVNIKDVDMKALTGKGAGMAKSFLKMAADKSFAVNEEINEVLIKFFGELSKTGAEFGYRSASEIMQLIHQLTVLDKELSVPKKIDIAIMQKLLPKLHGSQRRMSSTLKTLGSFCISSSIDIEKILLDEKFDYNGTEVLYPLSLEKIARMYRGALANGFTSFAEA